MADTNPTGLEASIAGMRRRCAEAKASPSRKIRMAGEAVEATLVPFVEWLTARAKDASANNAPTAEFCADVIEATASAVANIMANAANMIGPTTGIPRERAASFVTTMVLAELARQTAQFDDAFLGRTAFVNGEEQNFDFRDHMKKET